MKSAAIAALALLVFAGGAKAQTPFASTTLPAQCATGAVPWSNSPLAAQTGIFQFQFDATPSTSAVDAVMGLSAAPASAYANLSANIRFNQEGTIDALNGTSYQAASPLPYLAGITQHFTMIVNVTAMTFSAYVGNTPIALNFKFRSGSVAKSLANFATESDVGTVTVCAHTFTPVHQVSIAWPAISTATGYIVTRLGGSSGSSTTMLGAVTSFVDTSVVAATTYTYTVTAVGSGGVKSPPSNLLSVTIPY